MPPVRADPTARLGSRFVWTDVATTAAPDLLAWADVLDRLAAYDHVWVHQYLAADLVFDVIAAVEPVDDARRCILRGIPCSPDGRCAVHDTFDQARSAMQDRLAATTLTELVRPRR